MPDLLMTDAEKQPDGDADFRHRPATEVSAREGYGILQGKPLARGDASRRACCGIRRPARDVREPRGKVGPGGNRQQKST
jgi:hypothetical protein